MHHSHHGHGIGHGVGHHGRHHHSHNVDGNISMAEQTANFNLAAAGSIYIIRPKGADSSVGCPILCKGQSIECGFNANFLPDELNGIVSLTDFTIMVAEVKYLFSTTTYTSFEHLIFSLW